jgi:hypothetical protein
MKLTRIAITLSAGLVLNANAYADGFVTVMPTSYGFISGLSALDLSSTGASLGTAGSASTTVGPFEITNGGTAVVIGETTPVQLGANGLWSISDNKGWGSQTALGAFVNGNLNNDNSVTFALAPGKTTAFVGFYYNTDATPDLTPGTLSLQVLNAQGQAIATSASQTVTGTDVTNGASFIGYTSDAGAIAGFKVNGAYHVYGDITYAEPVPEPHELALMLAGRSAVGAVLRRRRNAASATVAA